MAKFTPGDWVVVMTGEERGAVAKVGMTMSKGVRVFSPSQGHRTIPSRSLRLATEPERLIGQRAQPVSDDKLPKAARGASEDAE